MKEGLPQGKLREGRSSEEHEDASRPLKNRKGYIGIDGRKRNQQKTNTPGQKERAKYWVCGERIGDLKKKEKDKKITFRENRGEEYLKVLARINR